MNDLEKRNIFQKSLEKTVEKTVYGFELARTLTFAGQWMGLAAFEFLMTRNHKMLQRPEPAQRLKHSIQDLLNLLKKDALNISRGVYPIEVLKPEPASDFLRRSPKILLDAFKVHSRRQNHVTKDFSDEAKDYLGDLPDYFLRNFHFQTGGYLTEKSADLYEHQVEILFSGTGDPMRRLILPAMKKHFGTSRGENLHFLEVGAGTGRLSRFVKLTFPKARITVLDLSDPYLARAQKNLKGFKKMNFVQGDAAALPFIDTKFDAVFSSFMFHELPLGVRKKVLFEAHRVLNENGFLGLVDSVQLHDKKDYDWALEQFPLDFHEPFYKNYLQNPLEGLVHASGFNDVQTEVGFFSKYVSAVKTKQH